MCRLAWKRALTAAQQLNDLARLRRVRDRMDREYAQPLDVEALARDAHLSAGHLSRQFRLAYGESPYGYLMTRRTERAMALLCRGGLGVTAVRGETDHQTDQDSRSADPRAAPSVTAMDITIHTSVLPHDDPDASLAFYRDTLGFEVRSDVGQGKMRWITVGPVNQPGTSILLAPPAADPGITDEERRTIAEMMAKGTYGWILLATKDLNGTFDKVQAGDAEVVQEPTEQPYGVRDCAFRDPAGNLIRIQEVR
jgi:AraC-like DNA-binding protein